MSLYRQPLPYIDTIELNFYYENHSNYCKFALKTLYIGIIKKKLNIYHGYQFFILNDFENLQLITNKAEKLMCITNTA